MRWTISLPAPMRAAPAYARAWKQTFHSGAGFDSSSGIEKDGASGSGSAVDTASGHPFSRALCAAATAAVRMPLGRSEWTGDPASNNVWRSMSYQTRVNPIVSPGDRKPGPNLKPDPVYIGDCEDLALSAKEQIQYSGVLDEWGIEEIGLAACVVEKKGVLDSGSGLEFPVLGGPGDPALRDVSVRTAHMVLAARLRGSDRIFVADCTSKSPRWRWAGRVYWLLLEPYGSVSETRSSVQACPGTTYLLADTRRRSGKMAGVDVEPGGSFEAPLASGMLRPGPRMVGHLASATGRAMALEAAGTMERILENI